MLSHPDWYFFGFLAPLVLGLLIVIGIAMGISDGDGDGAGAADADPVPDGHGHGHEALSVLGFGRTPFLVVVMMLLLWFGGAGLVCWFFAMPVLIAVPTAALASYGLSRASAGAISRFLPALETTSVKTRDFTGLTAVVTLGASPGGQGLAHVTKGGDIYQINFKSDEPLARGQRVLVVEVDAGTGVYSVCSDPTSEGN